jgi:hypothetical protein
MDARAEQMKAAIERSDLSEIGDLVHGGFDLQSPVFKDNGHAALHHAVNLGRTEAAALLIEIGADVNARLDGRATAMHLAAFHSRPEMLHLLIKAGADVRVVDERGASVLHWWSSGSPSLVAGNILLDAGSDPNAFDRQFKPVLLANLSSDARCAVLIKGGASTSFIPAGAPASYLTPFQAMVQRGSVEMVALLIESGRESFEQTTLDGRTLGSLAEGNGEKMRNYVMALLSHKAVIGALLVDDAGLEPASLPRQSRSAPTL